MGEFLFNKLFKVNYSFNVKMQIIGDTQVLIDQTCLYVTLLSFNLTCFMHSWGSDTHISTKFLKNLWNSRVSKKTILDYIYIYTLYCQKYIGSPPSNYRFDYFSNFHEYKS